MSLQSGSLLPSHQVINGAECVVGMQQCRAELGHPIAGLAVAIETNANARTERRREKKYQTVSESGGQDHASTLTRPPLCFICLCNLCTHPIGSSSVGKRTAQGWPPPVAKVT